MADADAASIRAARGDWISEHLKTYLASGGARGHILDVSAVGGRELTMHCLIKVVGRKSGKSYIRPLIYGNVGGEIVIVGSKGGADTHPEWYLNILASETIASFSGLGHQIVNYSDEMDTPKMFAYTLLVLVIATTLNRLVTALEAFARRKIA